MRAMMLYDPISISLFTATWTVGMAAMMFPAITPMVFLYNRLIRGGDNATQKQKHADENLMVEEKHEHNNKPISLRLTLFVTCYLVVWALTGIALLLGWSIPMNSLLVGNGKERLVDTIFGVVLKIWSRYGIWIARITGTGFVIIGLFTMVGIITLQNNFIVNNMHTSGSTSGGGFSNENMKHSKSNDNKMSNMKGMGFITISKDSSKSHLTI